MKGIRDENSNLRAKIRRLEEDNTRKRKEIDTLYDSNKVRLDKHVTLSINNSLFRMEIYVEL